MYQFKKPVKLLGLGPLSYELGHQPWMLLNIGHWDIFHKSKTHWSRLTHFLMSEGIVGIWRITKERNGVGAGDGEEAFFSCEDPNSLTHSRALASSSAMQLHQPCRSLPDFPVSDFVEPSFIWSDLTTRFE